MFWAPDTQQGTDLCDVGLAGRAGQQAVVPDAVEAIGQDVDQEPADELGRGQPHDLLPVARFDAIVFPSEGHGLGIGADQAVVRDRDPVGVSAEISQHGLGSAEGRFGIDHPFGFAERGEPGAEGVRAFQLGQMVEKDQLTGPVQIHQPVQKQAPEQPRQNPHMQKEPRLAGDPPRAIGRQAAARNDHMDVGMMGQRRSPSVQHTGHADTGAKARGVGGDRHDRCRRCLEEQSVDRLLVPIGDLGDLGRQGEDDVEILHGQQVLRARFHPIPRRRSLTLWAVPVLAGVVGDVMVAAFDTARHMPAKRLGPAGFNRRHHLQLGQADVPRIGLPPRRTIGTKDVSQVQRWPGHPRTRSLQASLHRLILQLGQHLVGADGIPDRLGGHVGISGGGRQLGVAEQHLDHPHVRVGLQKVGGKAVPQRVQGGGLPDPGHVFGRGEGAAQLAR